MGNFISLQKMYTFDKKKIMNTFQIIKGNKYHAPYGLSLSEKG